MSDLIPLTALAIEAQMHPLSMKKSVIRAGFVPQTVRVKGRRCYALSRTEADLFLANRNTDGVIESTSQGEGLGGIYLLRPDPALRPNRLKIGKAVSFENRMKGHKCIAPELEVLALWPTQSQWMEQMAIGILANHAGVRFASQEVCDVGDVEEVRSLLNDAFAKQGVKSICVGE